MGTPGTVINWNWLQLLGGCRQLNDNLLVRLPIKLRLMEMILFELERIFVNQPYLEILYKAMISLGYYGLLRVGELAWGSHTIKACNIFIATNKKKILLMLYSSKTHDHKNHPQKITITGLDGEQHVKSRHYFCPFSILRTYFNMRQGYYDRDENFFVFSDHSPVYPAHLCKILRQALENLGFNPLLFNVHSLRIGHVTQMFKDGKSVDYIKDIGRWKSNAVYKYLKHF